MKTIAIHDNEPAQIRDMTTNFYISDEDLGKPRAEVREILKLLLLGLFIQTT